MLEGPPRDNFLAEPLDGALVGAEVCGERKRSTTHTEYLLQVTVFIRPHDLHSNLPTAVFPLPHVRVPAPIQCDPGSIVANGDLHRFRKKRVEAARPVQQLEALLFGPWRKF